MQKQQEQVVKPLLIEVAVKDEMVKRLRAEHEDLQHDLKKLQTVIRLPTMCQKYHQAIKSRKDDQRLQSL